jgi:hypothetical protein
MQAIPAANDLRIEFDAESWRLVSHELETETRLVEATPEGLVTHPVFRAARSLPGATIAPAQIVRVMLGWAPENEAWRLGLLLTDGSATVVDTTQMQWCELAAWPGELFEADPQRLRYAGQALARLLNRPFQLVPPSTPSRVPAIGTTPAPLDDIDADLDADDEDTPENTNLSNPTAQTAPPNIRHLVPEIEVADLPIMVTHWRLIPTATGVQWERLQRWWLFGIGRLVLIFALSVLFLVLSIGSLTRGIAAVEPTWLPNLGVAIGLVLVVALLQTLWTMLNSRMVAVDRFRGELYERGVLLPFIHWRIPFDQIEYILISQNAPRPMGRRQHREPMHTAQDIWLHAFDGQNFYTIIHFEDVEGRSWDWTTVRTHHRTHVRRNLQLAQYDTPAHHAASQIADIIGVPVYLDLV